MTITGMTRFVQQNYKVQNSHLTHKLPNGSLPPKEHVNPYCPEGMDITGRTDFRRIVPVDEGVANKIKSLVFESMEKNCGMSDGKNAYCRAIWYQCPMRVGFIIKYAAL